MTRAELIEKLTAGQRHLAAADLEAAVKLLLGEMSGALAAGDRIEVRGFGSFGVRYGRHALAATRAPAPP